MKKRCDSNEPLRRGNVLVMVAILIFVLLPLASLVLQSGWLTLTRQQMQSGTDLAAIEAMRGRDVSTDEQRRRDARDATRLLYDDDLDPTADAMRFSAGPVINFSGGTPINGGTFNAGRRIDSADQYDPELELNLADNPAGDLVAGTYNSASASHAERSDYSRDDFDIDGGANSFLARMRRSNESNEDGIRSSGPTVPFLFGRGPYGGPGIANAGETDFMSLVERGAIVRATSIADAMPVWTVGPRVVSPPTIGAASFIVDEAAWTNPAINWASPLAVDFPGDGSILETATGIEIGRFIEPPSRPVSIGDHIEWLVVTPTLIDFGTESFGVVGIREPAMQESLVCGFGVVSLTPGGGTEDAFMVRSDGRVADQNASATYLGEGLSTLTEAQRTGLFDAMGRVEANAGESQLLAPALRRAID